MIETIATAAAFGFAAGFMPGPLQTFLLLQTLRHGPRAGAWVLPAPLVSDGPIIAVCLLVLTRVGDDLLRLLSFAGGAFLLYLAFESWRSLRQPVQAADGDGGSSATDTGAGSGRLAILWRATLANGLGPGPWLFWGTVMGPMLVQHWRRSALEAAAFLAAFYGTMLAVLSVVLLLFATARRRGPRLARVGGWIGLVLLLGFAVVLMLFGAGVIDRYGL